ncbi:hypothetical protein L0152_22885, partial [bacterium]|nr:hypothetical protein [bacterium]
LNSPAGNRDPMGSGAIGDFLTEQEIKQHSAESIKQWQKNMKAEIRRDAVCSSYVAQFKGKTGRDAKARELIYGSDPEELYIWFLGNGNEGWNCGFSREIGLTETGHEFIVTSAASVGIKALAMGATTGVALTAAADEFVGQTVGVNPSAVKNLSKGIWELGGSPRGLKIEDIVEESGLLAGRLPKNFETGDFFDQGVFTSLKSIDLGTKTFQDPKKLFNKLKNYVDLLNEFPGARLSGVVISPNDITKKALHIAIPPGQVNPLQRLAIEGARQYAGEQGIDFLVYSVE